MRLWLSGVILLLLAACGPAETYQPTLSRQPASTVPEYVVGVHPLHNPQRLTELYAPLVEHIGARLPGIRLRLEASRNYEEYEKKLYAGHFAFALPNPYQTVRALSHGYRVFGKMADDEDFRGLILVREDSAVRQVSDLKGQVVVYPAATALAATLLPQDFLHRHGIDINRDIENRYVGSQESAILNVLRGQAAAAATWPVPWKNFLTEQPAQAARLRVMWQTDSLPNNSWMVRTDVPESLARRFAELLFALKDSDDGRALLRRLPISAFEPASDATYEPVRTFLRRFAREVRPIEY